MRPGRGKPAMAVRMDSAGAVQIDPFEQHAPAVSISASVLPVISGE